MDEEGQVVESHRNDQHIEPAANLKCDQPIPFEHEERAKKHLARRKHEKKEKPKRKLAKGGLSRKEEKQLGQQLIQQLMDNQNLLTSSYTKNGTCNTISFSFLLCSLHWPIYVVFAGLFILSYISSTLLLVLSFLLFSPHFL